MTSFDYLTILISIVLGLAVANVLARLAAVMSARENVDFYWPPIAWAVWLFFIAVQHWWALWGARRTTEWTFVGFWLELLTPVLLFLLSALVLPERADEGRLDLGEWFDHNRAWFFGILFLLPAVSIVEEPVRAGHYGSMLNIAFLVAFEIVSLVALALKSRRALEWITGQAMVMTLLYVALLFARLPS